MFHAHRKRRIGLAIALLAIANTRPAIARDGNSTYVAGYEFETPSGIVRTSETLDVQRHDSTTSFARVSNASGALVSLPIAFAADGEIMANAFDPSVTCYNMAAAALYSNDRDPTRPAAIYVRLGENTVAVPLALKATGTTAGLRVIAGSGATAFTLSSDSAQIPGGMVVDARIAVADGALSDVVFNEATLVGSPARPVSRMTCSLHEAPAPAAPTAVLPG